MICCRRFLGLPTAGVSFVLLLVISCQGPDRKYIIPEKKLVYLLADLHLADAIASNKRDLNNTYLIDSASLYGSVLNKYGVTKAQFDSTISYYSKRPVELEKIYNSVITQMDRRETELTDLEKSEMVKGKVIWQDERIFNFPPLAASRIEINVPIKGPGLYTVSANIKMFPDDSSLNPRMSVYFYFDNQTPTGNREYFDEVMITRRNGESNTYSVSKKLVDPQIDHIKGYIVNYSNNDSLFRRHMMVSEIKVTMKPGEPAGRQGRGQAPLPASQETSPVIIR
jgi:hypothetical protein